MRRIFQEDATAVTGQKFLVMIEEQQTAGNAIQTDEWKAILEELKIGRASFYAMRNKLLGAGLISIKNKEYRLSGQFSKDLLDMARWVGGLQFSMTQRKNCNASITFCY